MSKIFLSVVIPSYDEMANLQKGVLDKVSHFLEKKKYKYEVIIVDDGSVDGSDKFVSQFANENANFIFIKQQHSGKAGAVTKGVLSAQGEYVLFTDMDQATPIEEVDKLLPYLEKGFDIVIGSRNNIRKGSPWTRVIMSRGWMFSRSMITPIKGIQDTQCGFKLFRHDVAQRLFSYQNSLHSGYKKVSGSSVSAGFDVELLYIAQKMKYSIKEIPVNWLYVETRRVNPLRDSLDGIKDLLKIRLNEWKGIYSKI